MKRRHDRSFVSGLKQAFVVWWLYRSFPDCMLLVAGATFCPPTQPVQYQRLKELEAQINESEQRKARLVRRCARTAITTRLNNRTIPHGNKLCAGCHDNPA